MVKIKDAYYFPHDSNAKDDPKCIMLIEQLGLEGYGIFWVLIETLRDQPGYKYPLALLPALARRFNTTLDKMRVAVMNYGLFEIENNEFFFSESLQRRMFEFDRKRELARIAGKRSAEKRLQLNEGSTDVQRTFNDGSTSKVNNSIVNNSSSSSKGNIFQFYQKNIGFISPNQAEVIGSYLDDGLTEELIISAIKDSLGAGNKWTYLQSIMKNCIDANIVTAEQYEAKKVERQNRAIKPQKKGCDASSVIEKLAKEGYFDEDE